MFLKSYSKQKLPRFTCYLYSLTLILLLLLAPSHSFSFGANAHRVLSSIAEDHLTTRARTAIRVILAGESLSAASTWADEMRAMPDNPAFWGYDYSANWHFINIAKKQDYVQAHKHIKGDAYQALLCFIAILEQRTVPAGAIKTGLEFYFGDLTHVKKQAQLQRFALKFLIHLVGDLHQPLHIGYLKDRGGNTINIKWFGRKSTLHRVWDTQLLQAQNLNNQQLKQKLVSQISAMPSSKVKHIQQASPREWLGESLSLRGDIYAVERFKSDFKQSYVSQFSFLIEQQLNKAALRLAALLNETFD